jgi:hypothetical protein
MARKHRVAAALLGMAMLAPAPPDGGALTRGAIIRQFYMDRADRFAEPTLHIGEGQEFVPLPRPGGFEETPPAVLEACGFYYINVMKRDLGGVHVFRATAGGTTTFAVLATTDGDAAHLEVYGAAGDQIGAALLDAPAALIWADREVVRRRARGVGLD